MSFPYVTHRRRYWLEVQIPWPRMRPLVLPRFCKSPPRLSLPAEGITLPHWNLHYLRRRMNKPFKVLGAASSFLPLLFSTRLNFEFTCRLKCTDANSVTTLSQTEGMEQGLYGWPTFARSRTLLCLDVPQQFEQHVASVMLAPWRGGESRALD
ncbi:hypothetical protein BC834DRAFT_1043892 [Gloeopeniophorella convolvens]|nr:hypothetical protein BC834DRAFT_1043892 [Gloeopeniophorella convolvens]